MPRYHHRTSPLSRLTAETIDFVIECVRDATEVLYGIEALDARDMIVVARSVFETERLFELEARAIAEDLDAPRSDWTLACMADRMVQAAQRLSARHAHEAAAGARAEWRKLLRRLVDSPFESPLLDYGRALSELIEHCPPAETRERLALLPRYLAHDLQRNSGANVLRALRDVARAHLKLEQAEIALHMFTQIVRYDPLDIWTHVDLAETLERNHPEVALAAAERTLLLLPREDVHDLRPRMRSVVERTRGTTATPTSATARALISQLQAKPGKRSRSSLMTLCRELVPHVDRVPVRDKEQLPDVAGLARLRQDLRTLPRPLRPVESTATTRSTSNTVLAGARPAGGVPSMTFAGAVGRPKVGRNDPCTCGSNKKWKRCCGAR